MANAAITVEGADELRKALRHIGDQGLKDALKAAHKDSAQKVVQRALPNVPVRSGRLRASTRARGSQKDGRVMAGSARVDYAAAIHWGRKQRGVIEARPYLWNAAQDLTHVIEEEFSAELDRILDAINAR